MDSDKKIRDEAIVLRVRDWQAADKYAVAFSRGHGKLRFIAYGARYAKNTAGRLVQPFAVLAAELDAGSKTHRLRGCELVRLPHHLDLKQMAYGAVALELTEVLTEDGEAQPEIYELLDQALQALTQRNPRLTVVAYALQLLALAGFAPQTDACVSCGRDLTGEECRFSPLQGGSVCLQCSSGGEEAFGADTRALLKLLQGLDFCHPPAFKVRGATLMELEKLLCKFIVFQTDQPLKSLNFLAQAGV